jgi:hypothetical protein
MMRQVQVIRFGAVACLLSLAPAAKADFLFQSATPLISGPFSNASGVATGTQFFSGFTFQVTTPVHVTDIGGDFAATVEGGQIFGTIVPVSGPLAPPNPADLSNNVGTTLLDLPSPLLTSANISGNLSADLSPGFYAVLFGSGKFGATSDFAIAITQQDGQQANAPIAGVLTYVIKEFDNSLIPQAPGARYFVEGTFIQPPAVPEPPTALLLAIGMAVLFGITFWKTKRGAAQHLAA